MRAPRAHGRRPAGQCRLGWLESGLARDGRPDDIGIQLTAERHAVLAVTGNAQGPDHLLHEGVELLDHPEFLDLGSKCPDELAWKGVRHAELQERGVREGLLRILIGHARGYDAQVGARHLHSVHGGGLGELPQGHHPLLDDRMTSPRVCGQHHPLRRMPLEGRRLLRLNLTELHNAHGVRDPRGGPDHDGRSILLAYPERLPGEVLRLLGAGRLEECDLGEARIVPVVLFILGGKQFGVVCADEHDPSPHQGVRQSHQRVRGHVHADVLHDGQRPGPCVGSAHSHLEGHLLVGGPFGMDIRVLFHDRLEDLGAWCAGVC
ncbi:MAG: hypothetical protein BWZ01_03125 [Deltaproteobacteria bacterium ADurb.BinA179]|nr:MAG: hypothetical protein BWZ01_03125 [Deltaproteobacteria bacterium ADurb.BinA179]